MASNSIPVPPPAPEERERLTRIQIDRSCRQTVVWYYASAVFWLLAGSLLALIASIKMHTPGFLADWEWLTFGRARPAHLAAMIYGWGSMAGVGTLLWLQARLTRNRLPFPTLLPATAVIWNLTVAYGVVAILAGYSTSIEWIEIPPATAILFGFCIAVIIAASVKMFRNRESEHTYVSQWYLFGAIFWFPLLYVSAQIFLHTPAAVGAVKAAANWWFAHNVLGLWFTPIGLATVYYLIPKVIGRPVHSYHLSLLGFWTLAIFYNWAGTHHLIGGPLPAWLITVGIVGSVMMFVPVVTVAVNHHLTMVGHFHHLKYSPTLRFIVYGAMCYTAVSFQGSLQSLRKVNEISHFTHYTIAHAHLGVYAFFTMVMFGAIYYVAPRLLNTEWHSAGWIRVHFWATAVGMAIYWLGLTWAGWEQGKMMNDPRIPFLEIVKFTVPWLWSRSAAGVLMTVGHLAFAWLFWNMLRQRGAYLPGPTLLVRKSEPETVAAGGGE